MLKVTEILTQMHEHAAAEPTKLLSSPARSNLCKKLRILVAIATCFLPSLCARAQAQTYADYPQTRGKVQNFTLAGLPSWMSLDMQIRERVEQSSSFGYTQGNDRIYDLTREYGGITIRPSSSLTAYMQFMDTHALGLPLHAVASNMRDTFDLRQGYLEYRRDHSAFIAGRRELKYGNERVIGISDFSNNSRSWDGFYAHLGDRSDTNNVDLFSTSVVLVHPTSHDTHGAGLTFHGVYGTIGSWAPKATLQPFVLVRTAPRVKSQRGTFGSELETTFGAEIQGSLPAHFSYDILGDLQRGSYSNNSIHAGADVIKVTYLFNNLPWKPRLGGEYDYATGNPHRNPDRVSTYDQQYPSNHNAFGLFDLFGFQNIKQQRINLDLEPNKNLTLLLQGEALGVASRFDHVYSSAAGITVAAPARGFATNSIGDAFDLSAKYVLDEYWVWNAGLSHYFPGSLMTANHHGAPLTYAYLSITYRFKVNPK
ncbi:MAG TPA: alginate export family protein [Terracidiphilus sp.]|nr:alginate export family protein [Terracidiphilus sp.]